MDKNRRFIGIRTKIIASTIIPVSLSFLLISSVLFISLFNSLREGAEGEFLKISQNYVTDFEAKINEALDYLSVVASTIELQAESGAADRIALQKTVMHIFEDYGKIDGSSIYFEPNMYDGKDDQYVASEYGTALSGRICYYFYKIDGKTIFLPEALENDAEFDMPHYTEVKNLNKPIYTKQEIYEIDGKSIPMFTIAFPIKNSHNVFIGAVTVDLFLEDMYDRIKNEKIYETGYIIIVNDKNQVIYSPIAEDIGKSREEAGLAYNLPSDNETAVYSNIKSILNGKNSIIAISSVYIPRIDSSFYISASAPVQEINAKGSDLLIVIVIFSMIVTALIAILLYYLINKVTSPIKELTENVNKIAAGDYKTRIRGNYKGEFAVVKDSVNTMADNIEAYIDKSNNSLNILKNILDGLDAIIYVTVPDTGEILFINQNMKDHFHLEGNVIGQYCYKVFQEGMDERCVFCPCYKLDKNPDSAVIWEEHNTVTKRIYRNTDCYIDWLGGEKVHLQHSVDITDLKQYMEDKLVAERAALELKHEKEKAEASAQAKNDFLAKMSHEIRTPMNAVMGMIELILRKDLPQDVYEHALVIKSASANLLSIINDILDFSKIESGMLEIVETEYLLPSMMNDVINITRIRLVDKPIQFAVQIDPKLPSCLLGDEIRIRQICINLLSNAVKYTKEGYILMKVTGVADENTITLTIEVSDSGIGIKKENIDKLFGDFVQIDMVKNKGIEGTGLGLAISRGLCRAMGGDIEVRSDYGNGSTFTVTLPQKITEYKPFASVDNVDEVSVLLYETRETYKTSIAKTLDSLQVRYKLAENISELFDNLSKYQFVFVPSFIHGSIIPAIAKFDNPPKLVLMADIAEVSAPKNARILILPANPLSVANILNDVREEVTSSTGASFIAPEAKVLIVDDIMANLKVCEGLLLPYEMQVTICDGGYDSLHLVAENEYDIVFMDHMMPEMDGLEATRLIREMDGDYFKNLPIIALTANAVSGVREMFIQNGMNDFLAKPIETIKLDAILDKWIPKEKRKTVAVGEIEDVESELINILRTIPELSVDKALSVIGSAQAYDRIIRLSTRLLPENIERLKTLIDTDLPNYAIEVHGIKGVLNNIGAYALGNVAYDLEELSGNGELDACLKIHPVFIDKLVKFSDLMLELIKEDDGEEKTEGDMQAFLGALANLKEATDFFDSVQALEILSDVMKYTYGKTIDKFNSDLLYAFERFDFDSAAELIRALEDYLGAVN